MKLTHFVRTRLTKLSSIFLVLMMTTQSASAFDVNFDTLNTNKITGKVSYEGLINKIPTLFVFEERDAEYMVDVIKNKYLTFYSDKNEKLKATYASGAYFIKYTSNW